MKPIFRSIFRAFKSLFTPGVLWQLIWPTLLSVGFWGAVAYLTWTDITLFIENGLKYFSWIQYYANTNPGLWNMVQFVISANVFVFWLLLIYATAVLLVATFALPRILERVARTDYADLALMHGGSTLGGISNTLWAMLVFIVVLVLSLPLWLLPGVGVVILVLLTGWLNVKTFGYDVLMLHADKTERRNLLKANHSSLMLLGCICALLTYVPFVNLISAAFCGLAFTHFLLEALRQARHHDSGTVAAEPTLDASKNSDSVSTKEESIP